MADEPLRAADYPLPSLEMTNVAAPVDDNPGHPSFRPLEIWDDSRVLKLGQEQWRAMENGSWDSGLSRQAQLELEKQLERAATTLTEGQKKALSKTIRTQGEIGGDGYDTRRRTAAAAKL